MDEIFFTNAKNSLIKTLNSSNQPMFADEKKQAYINEIFDSLKKNVENAESEEQNSEKAHVNRDAMEDVDIPTFLRMK